MIRLQRWFLATGALATVIMIAGMALDGVGFFRSYLFAFLFCLGLSLGALANLMLHAITGGSWGIPLREPLTAAARIMPLNALMFAPLLLGLPFVYGWMSAPATVSVKSWWLDEPFFIVRAAFYLIVWCALAWRWLSIASSFSADASEQRPPALRRLSAGGLIVYGLTVSLAAVDWIMSLTPDWYSTAFGLLVGVSQMLSGMALGVIACTFIRCETPDLLHDLGNLLLMYVMSWAYVAFTQFLIIWAEDLPNETVWYAPRMQTSWRWLSLSLVVLQFALPFLLLLSRVAKRTARYIGPLAAGLLAGQLLFFFYLVTPALEPDGFTLSWTDPLAVIALGGLWCAAWLRNLSAARFIRTNAP